MAQRSSAAQRPASALTTTLLILVTVRNSKALYLPLAADGPAPPERCSHSGTLTDGPQSAAPTPTPAAEVAESTTTPDMWTDSPEAVTAPVDLPPGSNATAGVRDAVVFNLAWPVAVTPSDASKPLLESVVRQSSGAGRYASGFSTGPQGRSLYRAVTPLQPNETPEIRKDVYIHLAADEPPPSSAQPTLAPRKHYKIIVIKPPTVAPPVEVTTRAVDVETLIYVLVPKVDAPPPATTTPRPPSKHEVFFIRYKSAATTAATVSEDAVDPDIDVRSANTPPTSSDKSHEGSDLLSTTVEDGEDQNELDGEVRDDDAANDLLSVSTDDILRSWRRSDGDLHFDADLKRIARSHSGGRAEDDLDAVRKAVGEAVGQALSVAAAHPTERCAEYAAAEDLNAALAADEEAGEEAAGRGGKRVQGGPDFEAVRQGRAHYGRPVRSARSVALCAQPFAIRDDIVSSESAPTATPPPPPEAARRADTVAEDASPGVVSTKTVKFSAKFSGR